MPRKPKYGRKGDVIEVTCVACDVIFIWTVGSGGRPRQRCDACWLENERSVDADYARQWREAHPERMRAINRKSYRKCHHATWRRHRRRTSRQFLNSCRLSSRRAYRKRMSTSAGRQKQRNFRYNRRAKEKTSGGRLLTAPQWQLTLDAFGGQCAYCGVSLPTHQDHFIPLSKGGLTILGNMVPSCPSCNYHKRDFLPQVFLPAILYSSIVKVLSALSS